MAHNISINSKVALNLKAFNFYNSPLELGELELDTPKERQYILRMIIKKYYSGWKIPKELQWCMPLIKKADSYQKVMGINHAFCYLTVRSGIVDSVTDDEWHTDGFSTKITHLPEQNYIWSDTNPTEYIMKPIQFPKDFDPLVHNVHKYIQNKILDEKPIDKVMSQVRTCKEKHVYCLDPYVIHRRSPETKGIQRTFVRVSFVPIEILDKNNTINPELPDTSDRDGVEIRNQLVEYK